MQFALNKDFLKNMEGLFKDDFSDFLKSLNTDKPPSIRINSRKISKKDFIRLYPYELMEIKYDEYGFFLPNLENPFDLFLHSVGSYYIQEASAMSVVNFMNLEKGMNVLDLCSSPGGKTLQISDKISENGLLISNDISASRQRASLRNIEKFGISNTVITANKPDDFQKLFKGFFDAVLVDAPCSGEGMFAKDKNLAKNWDKDINHRYSIIQSEILNSAKTLVKPNGIIMYSTCTFSKIENEDIISEFLMNNRNFKLDEIYYENFQSGFNESLDVLKFTKRILPHKNLGSGHFFARLRKIDSKNNSNSNKTEQKFNLRKSSIKAPKCFTDFHNSISKQVLDGYFEEISSKLYFRKFDKFWSDCREIRTGLYLGDISKHGFIPSQHYAMFLDFDKLKTYIDLSSKKDLSLEYLKGMTLRMKKEKGYQLISSNSLVLGWVKSDGSCLKNKYKKDWIYK